MRGRFLKDLEEQEMQTLVELTAGVNNLSPKMDEVGIPCSVSIRLNMIRKLLGKQPFYIWCLDNINGLNTKKIHELMELTGNLNEYEGSKVEDFETIPGGLKDVSSGTPMPKTLPTADKVPIPTICEECNCQLIIEVNVEPCEIDNYSEDVTLSTICVGCGLIKERQCGIMNEDTDNVDWKKERKSKPSPDIIPLEERIMCRSQIVPATEEQKKKHNTLLKYNTLLDIVIRSDINCPAGVFDFQCNEKRFLNCSHGVVKDCWETRIQKEVDKKNNL